jgi:CRP/FNR family transcriptional regulator, cyclic AMP receptor protein
MEDLDFTRPARHEIYDPEVARSCFESLSKAQSVAQGERFFAEGEASEHMYLLLEGEVGLLRGKRSIDVVKPGEIFGEMAAITQQPRSASAIAKSACRVIALDAKQFQRAIQKTPQFVLMLMSIMINRLRLADAMAGTRNLPDWGAKDDTRMFDDALMHELLDALPERPPQRFTAGQTIMKEGESGIFMYVVLRGHVEVSIKSKVVERVGPGGVFGEMALVDQSPRAASAITDGNCSLLAINRNDLLALVEAKPAFAVSLLKAVAERLRRMT